MGKNVFWGCLTFLAEKEKNVHGTSEALSSVMLENECKYKEQLMEIINKINGWSCSMPIELMGGKKKKKTSYFDGKDCGRQE